MIEQNQRGVYWTLRPLMFLGFLIAANGLIAQSANTGGEHLFQPLTVDYMAEGAGATSTFGFFYLDLDTNGDGLPDFAQTGPLDDLDGDGLLNQDDPDDDGDGIMDYDDVEGYFMTNGEGAGLAPSSMPAHVFRFGLEAANNGVHPGDYWQFVPNDIHERFGAPYQDAAGDAYDHVFVNPGAYLYVDENQDEIPDVLQVNPGSNQVPAMAVDKGFMTQKDGRSQPGLLGVWGAHETGATLFHMCDDDGGTGSVSVYADHTPYKVNGQLLYADLESATNANPDYLIYGTDNPTDPAIPAALRTADPAGVALWRYRAYRERVSIERELVVFQTAYYNSGGSAVNTYYSKPGFNLDPASPRDPSYGSATGRHYGLNRLEDALGTPTPDHWFPRFQNRGDHDRVARAAFGDHVQWSDIATFPLDGSAPQALNGAGQEWVDQWENITRDRQVLAYLSGNRIGETSAVDVAQTMAQRYGVDVALSQNNRVIRAQNGRHGHAVVFPYANGESVYQLVGFEDLYAGGDRDFDDLLIVLNRPLMNDADALEFEYEEPSTCRFSDEVSIIGGIMGQAGAVSATWSLNGEPEQDLIGPGGDPTNMFQTISLVGAYEHQLIIRALDQDGNQMVKTHRIFNQVQSFEVTCEDIVVPSQGEGEPVQVYFEEPLHNAHDAFILWSHDPGSSFPPGETLVTVTVIDGCDVAQYCEFLVVVEDAMTGGVMGRNPGGDLIPYNSIQEAVWAVAADDLVAIEIAAGVYDETVYADGLTGVSIIADGHATIKGLTLMDCRNLFIAGLKVDAGAWWSGIQVGFPNYKTNHDIYFVDCTVRNSMGSGVTVEEGNSLIVMESCEIRDNGGSGVLARGFVDELILFETTVANNGQKGIDVSLGARTFIEYCTIRDNTWFGIDREYDPEGGLPEEITLIQNTFYGNGGYVVPGTHDENLGNYHQIIDPSDDQPNY